MDIFETWIEAVDVMLYEDLKVAFGSHSQQNENIVATRHRYLSNEKVENYIERVERQQEQLREEESREERRRWDRQEREEQP